MEFEVWTHSLELLHETRFGASCQFFRPNPVIDATMLGVGADLRSLRQAHASSPRRQTPSLGDVIQDLWVMQLSDVSAAARTVCTAHVFGQRSGITGILCRWGGSSVGGEAAGER